MFHCISILYFISSPFVGLLLHTFFSPSVPGCQMSMWTFNLIWESPETYQLVQIPHPLKPNSSPLDMWSPCVFWNLHWLPSSLNPCDRERLAPGLWKWPLSHTDPFSYSFSRCWLNTHAILGIEGIAVSRDKTSKTFCLHGVYIPVHAASTALCPLYPRARRILVLPRLLYLVGFCGSWVAMALAPSTRPL